MYVRDTPPNDVTPSNIKGWQVRCVTRRDTHTDQSTCTHPNTHTHTRGGNPKASFYLRGVIYFQITQDAPSCPPPHFSLFLFCHYPFISENLLFFGSVKLSNRLLFFSVWLSLLLFYSICIHASLVKPNSSLTRVSLSFLHSL